MLASRSCAEIENLMREANVPKEGHARAVACGDFSGIPSVIASERAETGDVTKVRVRGWQRGVAHEKGRHGL